MQTSRVGAVGARRQRVQRVLCIAAAGLLGALGIGYLAWGPLALRLPVALGVGLVGGIVNAGLWARQQQAAARGAVFSARRRAGHILLGHLAILAAVALLALAQLYLIGLFPPLTQDRVAGFQRLWRAIDLYYPYWDLKSIDWAATYDRYLPRIRAAESDEAYLAAVADMLAELGDAHTGLTFPGAGSRFAAVEEIEGRAVVTRAGEAARRLGLDRGAVVLAVNGRPTAEALEDLPARLRNGSTPRQQRYLAHQNLLTLPRDGELTVRFETPQGVERTETLRWPPEPSPNPLDSSPLITGRRLPSGLGLIRIPTFGGGGHDLAAEFDAALAPLMDTPGLIIDLRSNGGGNSAIADRIAGRFLEEPFTYGVEHYPGRLPLRGWLPSWHYRVSPRGETYAKPVVLLIDTGSMSTTETFIVSLTDCSRARTAGRPTGGASGNPVSFQLPGGARARFSTGAFYRNNGSPVEGLGITPDRTVHWTLADVRQGNDPDLAAAENMLLKQ